MVAIAESGARARRGPSGTRLGAAGIRLWRALLRKAHTPLLVLYALALGGGLGLASADFATRGGYPFGGVTIGAWKVWPRAGARDADPYTRAVHARRAEIPLAVGEGLLATASADDKGRPLDATCTYAVGGVVPPARAWTVTIAGRGAPEPGRVLPREGFTSTEILRERDGRFVITLARDPQPGNWLPMPRTSGPVRLALRLYDTPVAANVGALDRETVPAITRVGCP